MAALLFVILLICFGIFLNIRALYNNSGCFVYTEATIVRHEYDSGDGESTPSHYRAYYEYAVGTQKYTGVEYRAPSGHYIRWREEIEELFPIGSTSGIYINPSNPNWSSREAGGSASDNFGHVGCIVAGLVFIGVIILPVIMALTR